MVKNSSRVITFYSYKGGVGRSMAMANIGVILAQWGYKILLIDWDLEAPGLENFFKEFLNIDQVAVREGLIDLLDLKQINPEISVDEIDLSSYTITITLNDGSRLSLITAGKRDEFYIRKIKQFDFTSFYSESDGGEYLENLREKWLKEFDFILIDSRTGLTDSSGICSIHMPDILILLFTPNEQSFNGIKSVSKRAIEGQRQIIYDRFRLRTLPIPSRIEPAETLLLDQWMSRIYLESNEMLEWLPKKGEKLTEFLITPAQLLNQLKIPYKTYYAYGEKLPVVERGTKDQLDIGYPYETIAAVIANDFQNVDLLIDSRDVFVKKAQESLSLTNNELSEIKKEAITIFFADVADTLRSLKKRIVSELENNGFKIISNIPPPEDFYTHEINVKEQLQKADFAIHLLDQYPGREIAGEPNISYPQKQAELSLQNYKPKLFWTSEKINIDVIEEEGYKSFLNQFLNGRIQSDTVTYIQCAKSELTREIIIYAQKLRKELLALSVNKNQRASIEKPALLLNFHYIDKLYAEQLNKILLTHNIKSLVIQEGDNPRENINTLNDAMSSVNNIVFIYGKVSQDWILERMNATLQLIITNDYPVEEFFLLLMPPMKDPNEILLKQKFLKVNLIDNSHALRFESNVFLDFVKKIEFSL